MSKATEEQIARAMRLADGRVPARFALAVAHLINCDCPLDIETEYDAAGMEPVLTWITGQKHSADCGARFANGGKVGA